MQEIDGRPWYALIAGAVGTMNPAGRVLAELVGREECSEGSRFAQVLVINQLGRAETPFTFIGQLQKLAGDNWHPGSLNYFFLRALDSRAYKIRFEEIAGKLGADRQAPLAPEICFEHAIERAWEKWWDKLTEELPAMPEGLNIEFQEAVQLPLRRELCQQIHGIIEQMPGWLADQGVKDYGTEHQLSYARMVEGFTLTANRFLKSVEARAEALMQSDQQLVAQLTAKVEQIRAEQAEVTEDEPVLADGEQPE